jgi:hypothetical protein
LSIKELNARFSDSIIDAYQILLFERDDFEKKFGDERIFHLLECAIIAKSGSMVSAGSPLRGISLALGSNGYREDGTLIPLFKSAGIRGLLNFGYYFPEHILHPTFGLHARADWSAPDSNLWDDGMSSPEFAYLERAPSGEIAVKALIKDGLASIPPEVDENGNLHPSLKNARFLVDISEVDPDYLKQVMV